MYRHIAKLGIVTAGIAAAVLLAASLASASPSAPPAPVRVAGTQTEVDMAKGKFAMHGNLVGPWQITSFHLSYASATM